MFYDPVELYHLTGCHFLSHQLFQSVGVTMHPHGVGLSPVAFPDSVIKVWPQGNQRQRPQRLLVRGRAFQASQRVTRVVKPELWTGTNTRTKTEMKSRNLSTEEAPNHGTPGGQCRWEATHSPNHLHFGIFNREARPQCTLDTSLPRNVFGKSENSLYEMWASLFSANLFLT